MKVVVIRILDITSAINLNKVLFVTREKTASAAVILASSIVYKGEIWFVKSIGRHTLLKAYNNVNQQCYSFEKQCYSFYFSFLK